MPRCMYKRKGTQWQIILVGLTTLTNGSKAVRWKLSENLKIATKLALSIAKVFIRQLKRSEKQKGSSATAMTNEQVKNNFQYKYNTGD